MSEKKQYKENWLRRFLNYLSDKQSDQERNAFEKDLERDPFAAEAFEGLKDLSEEEILEDMEFLEKQLSLKTRKKNYLPFFRIAAGIALLAALSLSYYLIFERQIQEMPGNKEVSERAEPEKGTSGEYLQDSIIQVENPVEDISEVKPKQEIPTDKSPGVKEKTGKADESTVVLPVEDDLESELEILEAVALSEEVPELNELAFEESETRVVDIESIREPQVASRAAEQDYNKKALHPDYLSGKVISSEDSLPIPGVSVVLQGKLAGVAVTNNDGRFELPKPDSESVVVASFVGMKTEEVKISGSEFVNITMEPEPLMLDEVVTIGYGEKRTAQRAAAVEELNEADESGVENEYSTAYPLPDYESFRRYIEEEMVFPPNQTDVDRAVVILKFTVNQQGDPTAIRVIKSPDESFTKEAIRLLENGPKWQPPLQDGIYSGEETRLRIVFKKN